MASGVSVFLNVTDMQRSLDFYQKLGFRLDKAYTDKESGTVTYADLSLGDAEVGLGNIDWNDDPEFRAWVSTPLGAGVVVYVSTRDVDKVHERAQKIGAVIEFPPTDRPYGRLFMLNDPDGYSISFIREPTRAAAKRATGGRKGATKRAGKSAAKKSARKAPGKSAKKGAKTGARKAAKKSAKRTTNRRR